jgi:signal transduction histidine kinase
MGWFDESRHTARTRVTAIATTVRSPRAFGHAVAELGRKLLADEPETTPAAQSGVTAAVVRRAGALQRAHPQAADTLLAVVTAAATTPWILRPAAHAGAGTWLLQAALIIPLVWRRRQPQVVFGVLAVVAAIQWWTSIPLTADVSLLIALYTLAAHRTRFVAVSGAVVLEAGVGLAVTRWVLAGSWERSLVFVSGLVAAALLLGADLQSRRANIEALTERARRLETERDQQAKLAAAAERTRIAREMHDVIAHSLAVIVAMADGAAAKLRRDPDRSETAIRQVADVGREALRETRRLLGVLRDENGTAGYSPQPTIAQLAELVETIRAAGLETGLTVEGEPFPLPQGAELAVYRIVQEATTNTLKHAVAATTLGISLRYARPSVEITVVDDGRPRRDIVGEGHGIAGMHERVSLYNGTVTAGPGPTGGWAVFARLAVAASGT